MREQLGHIQLMPRDYPLLQLRSSASAICSDWHSTCSTRLDCNWTTKFAVSRPATWNSLPPALWSPGCRRAPSSGHWRRTCSRLLGAIETFSAPLRRFHDSGAGYIQTYLLTNCFWSDSLFWVISEDVVIEALVSAIIFSYCWLLVW